ncbi:MAG: hypothetical protein ACRCZD_01720 [Phycicoccus sp.]
MTSVPAGTVAPDGSTVSATTKRTEIGNGASSATTCSKAAGTVSAAGGHMPCSISIPTVPAEVAAALSTEAFGMPQAMPNASRRVIRPSAAARRAASSRPPGSAASSSAVRTSS